MKTLLLSSLILLMFNCKNAEKTYPINNNLIVIIEEYSKEIPLKEASNTEDLSKQSYEIGFLRINKDTILYIKKEIAYGSNTLSSLNFSLERDMIGIQDEDILKLPMYMGTFELQGNPYHIYDIRDKVGKMEYNLKELKSMDFKDFYIKEHMDDLEDITPMWIYKIEQGKYKLIKKTE